MNKIIIYFTSGVLISFCFMADYSLLHIEKKIGLMNEKLNVMCEKIGV